MKRINSSESVVPKQAVYLRVCVGFNYFKERDKPFGGQSRFCKKVRTAKKKLAYGQPRTTGFMMKRGFSTIRWECYSVGT